MDSRNIKHLIQAILFCLFLQPLSVSAQQKFNTFYTPQAIVLPNGTYETAGTMNDVAIDPQTGDIYLAGGIGGGWTHTAVSPFGYLGKLDSSGNPQWFENNRVLNNTLAYENKYTRLMVTSDNHVLALTGYFVTNTPNGYTGQLMLHKADMGGAMQIQKNYGEMYSPNIPYTKFSEGRSLIEAKDAAGSISYVAAGLFLTTYPTSTVTSECIFVVKTQTNLAPLWRKFYSFFNSGIHSERAQCIYQASDKNYILTGVSDDRLFIMKVDQGTGAVIWSHRYTMTNALITDPKSSGESISEDCSGNIIVSGAAGGRVVLLSVSSSGIFNWCDVLDCGTSGNTLMKDPASNLLSLGGADINGTWDYTFLLKFIPRNCTGNSVNTYISCNSYKTDNTNFPNMVHKKMLRTASGGYLFLNEYSPPAGTYEDYHFNLVSTDSSFKSSTGIFSMSDFCIPHLQSVAATSLTPAISGTATSTGTVISEDVDYKMVQARLLQHTYCQDCPEPTVSHVTLHVKCHERVFLSNNCDGFPVEWFDENGQLILGANTHSLSFIVNQSTRRTSREYHSNGCVRCEKNIEIIVDPPEVCFSLPATICTNQPIVPTFTCDMSRVNWHQWVVTELNGAWNNRVVKGNFPSGGPPQAIDIRTLWNGFIPGKCYAISLDLQDSCGYSNTQYQFFCVPAITENTITVTMCPLNGNNSRWFEPSQHCSGAYYTFLGNDSRNYPYGYPLSPGSYQLDCFDVNSCQTGRTTVQVVSIPVLAATTCTHTEFYCDVIPNPEGILPGNCPDCYRNDPRVELLPLQVMSVNGTVQYQRRIIDWDNCRECVFSFGIVDKACDFTVSSAYYFSAANPQTLTFFSTSSSGPGTQPCGARWTVRDLSGSVTTIYPGNMFSFTGAIGVTYEICLYVTNCACGRECEKSICTTLTMGEGGPWRMASGSGQSEAWNRAEESTLPIRVDKDIVVRPNPSSGKFILTNSSGLPVYKRVVIHDMNGKMVFAKETVSSGFEYDLSDLAKGIYVINVTTDTGIKNMKLVLE